MVSDRPCAARVNGERLRAHLQALEGDRNPLTQPERYLAAQTYLVTHFQRYGLKTVFDELSYQGSRFVNVIARSRVSETMPRLLIGAHLDTVPGTPGADDNASGLAVMLETASVISAELPHAPMEYVGFTLEEVGMVGSGHYAAALKRRGVSLLGMLSLEMVGYVATQQRYPPLLSRFYPPVGNFIGLVANRRSKPFLHVVERAMRSISQLPVETLTLPANGWMVPESRLSDHAPFWDAGYPALLITDTAFLRNPHYHQPTDTIETLDLAFLARVCQGVVEAVAALTDSTRSTMA